MNRRIVSAYITLISFGSSFGAVEEAVSTNINAGRQFYLRMFAIDYVLTAVVDFQVCLQFSRKYRVRAGFISEGASLQ
jgi:uncharacterized membrane protein (DUF485 family)